MGRFLQTKVFLSNVFFISQSKVVFVMKADVVIIVMFTLLGTEKVPVKHSVIIIISVE